MSIPWLDVCRRGGSILVIGRAAEDSPDGNPVFVGSTDSVDRMGDVVAQSWELGPFREAGGVALFNHDANQVAGSWLVDTVGGRLVGEFRATKAGPFAWVGDAVAERTLGATSVGFLPGSVELRNRLQKDDPLYQSAANDWEAGLVFGRHAPNELLELSIVSIPANRDAVRLGLGPTRGTPMPYHAEVTELRRSLITEGLRQMETRGQIEPATRPGPDPDFVRLMSQVRPSTPNANDQGIPWLRSAK